MRTLILITLFLFPLFTGERIIKRSISNFFHLKVTATCYQPSIDQCDSDPLMTASGSKINPRDPLGHRWIAVSRDLLKNHVKMGDTVHVHGTGVYDGKWVVKDKMNKRFKNKIDFLIGLQDKGGLWDNVILKINK